MEKRRFSVRVRFLFWCGRSRLQSNHAMHAGPKPVFCALSILHLESGEKSTRLSTLFPLKYLFCPERSTITSIPSPSRQTCGKHYLRWL